MLLELGMDTFRSKRWPLLWLRLWEGLVLGQPKGASWSPGGADSRPPRGVCGLQGGGVESMEGKGPRGSSAAYELQSELVSWGR